MTHGKSVSAVEHAAVIAAMMDGIYVSVMMMIAATDSTWVSWFAMNASAAVMESTVMKTAAAHAATVVESTTTVKTATAMEPSTAVKAAASTVESSTAVKTTASTATTAVNLDQFRSDIVRTHNCICCLNRWFFSSCERRASEKH
jgi:hypothetical protein